MEAVALAAALGIVVEDGAMDAVGKADEEGTGDDPSSLSSISDNDWGPPVAGSSYSV